MLNTENCNGAKTNTISELLTIIVNRSDVGVGLFQFFDHVLDREANGDHHWSKPGLGLGINVGGSVLNEELGLKKSKEKDAVLKRGLENRQECVWLLKSGFKKFVLRISEKGAELT